MAIDAVTTAIIDMLRESLGNQEGVPPNSYFISLASPNEGAANADVVLFLYLVTPAPELRNAERIRPWPGATDSPRVVAPAVALELHFLLTVGAGAPAGAAGLSRLADAIRAIETASPLAVPAVFQEAVWLSLLSLSSDEMARIWGLFPNENCRSSIAFRASPVWIDPRALPDEAPPVTEGSAQTGRMLAA